MKIVEYLVRSRKNLFNALKGMVFWGFFGWLKKRLHWKTGIKAEKLKLREDERKERVLL